MSVRAPPEFAPYFKNDERYRWFANMKLEPISGLPMLNDDLACSLKPQRGKWGAIASMRNDYNKIKPMTLILPGLWVGSKYAGHDSDLCLSNGITHVQCVAKGHQYQTRYRARGGRKTIQLDLIDLNAIVETPPFRKHDRIDLGFYQDSSREEHCFSRNT